MKNRPIFKRGAALCLAAATALSLSVAPAAASDALGTDLRKSEVELAKGVTVTDGSFWSATYKDLRTEHYITYQPNGTVQPLVWSGAQSDSLNKLTTAAEALAADGWRVVAGINGGFYNTSDGTPVGMVFYDGALRGLEDWNGHMLGFLSDGSAFVDDSVITKQVRWTCEVEVEIPDEPADPEPSESPEIPEDPAGSDTPEWPEDPTGSDTPEWPDLPWPEWPDPPAGEEGYGGARSARATELVTRSFQFDLKAVNANRANGGLYLFTGDFGATTQIGYAGVDIWLEPVDNDQKLTFNNEMSLRVVRVIDSMQAGVAVDPTIPEGCLVLSANKNCAEALLDGLRTLSPGDEVTVEISGADPRWSDAVCGITGFYRLLRDGQIVSGLPAGQSPRTAVGLRGDGAVIFYTIDGRQNGYSVGASYAQAAERLQELGCVDAVALDGGGSTTLGTTLPGSESFSVLNSPSGGVQRAVSTSLFLVTRAKSTDRPDRFYVSLENDVVLAGSKTSVTAVTVDENGYPVRNNSTIRFSSSGGTLETGGDGKAVFTAGSTAGDFTVDASGRVNGSAAVKVVDALTGLTVTKEGSRTAVGSLDLKPGDEVELDAHGYWRNIAVAMEDGDVEWAVTEELGVVDENGRLTITGEGSGSLTARAGGLTATVEVNVQGTDPFTDIVGDPYREYILALYDLGIVSGYPMGDGTFEYRSANILPRGEVLAYIAKLLRADLDLFADTELPFDDLHNDSDWRLPYLKILYALGVFNGSRDGEELNAKLDEVLTREAILSLLGRALAEQTEYDLSEMPDSDQISAWAVPYIQTMAARGVIDGAAPLSPKEGVTRGEMAMWISRLVELPLIQPVPPETGPEDPWTDPWQPGQEEPEDPEEEETAEPGQEDLPEPGEEEPAEPGQEEQPGPGMEEPPEQEGPTVRGASGQKFPLR